jgi:thiol reductant ABC exporter CydC subunit
MRTVIRLLGDTPSVLPRLILAVLAGTLSAACAIGLTATAAWLITRAAQRPPILELSVAIVAVRAFGVTKGFARYAERLAGHDAALRVLSILRVRSFARLIPLVPGAAVSGGDALQRFASDVDAGLDLLVRVLLPYAAALLAGVGAVALIGTILPSGALLLAVALIVVCFGIPALQRAQSRRAQAKTAPLRAELTTGIVKLLHALPDLVAYGLAANELERLRDIDSRLTATYGRSAVGVGLGNALTVACGGACVWAALALGDQHELSTIALAVLVLTQLAVLDVVAGLPEAASRYGLGTGALGRVYSLLDRSDPVPDPAAPRSLPAEPYELTVSNVAAGWVSGQPPVLSGVNLRLAPGRQIAVVGPTGCGKTTLANLLVRFLDPQHGQITLNGVDLRDLAGDDVRRVVALMDESGHCFDTTIEGNLRVGRHDASEAQLWDALSRARLADWVRGLPRGLSTPVGERGSRISGGQRRRLALARVLLTDAPILVLDEPTEHLDEETAEAITADLLAATKGRSLVLITHRRFGLSDVEEIVDLTVTR